MGRRRKGEKIDGWLVLDKPEGITSATAVNRVRAALQARKAGHAGTLDPMASGVLPIALGEATKLVSLIMDAGKEYVFTIRWGEERNTDDRDGEVTAESEVTPEAEALEAALGSFEGEIEQVPPNYSAIKVGGRRAYDLARKGEALALEPRRVRIDELALLAHDITARESRFLLRCGRGTYVRAIARDLGRTLGSYGYVASLRRSRVGPFDESRAISLEKLDAMRHCAPASSHVLEVATALDDIPAVAVTDAEAGRMRQGQSLRLPTSKEGRLCVTCGDRPVAVAEAEHGIVRPLRVLNL